MNIVKPDSNESMAQETNDKAQSRISSSKDDGSSKAQPIKDSQGSS